MVQRLAVLPLILAFGRRRPCFLPQSRGDCAGSSRVAAAGGCTQAQAAGSRPDPLGSIVLDWLTASVAQMVEGVGDRETRDRGGLASGWLSSVLAMAIPAARRSTEGERGGAESHPPLGD